MKVFIACEESQEICKEFRRLGHEAFSCDLLPCSGGHPEWHIQKDVREVLKDGGIEWDLIIAHPYCTHTAVSGARWFKGKEKEQKEAIEFFMFFVNLKCEKVVIEHPVSIMSTKYRKPDQIIQPYEFGEDASKKTCLWIKGLPKLNPTKIIKKEIYANQTPSGQNKLGPSKDRAKLRSKTYPGIAKAMAEQWGENEI